MSMPALTATHSEVDPTGDEQHSLQVERLIQEIIQQVSVLIVKLATAGGTRAPLDRLGDHLFVELARELKRQGVSTKVSADMFGLSLRTYQRKLLRLKKSPSRRGGALREAVLQLVGASGPLKRADILSRFTNDSARLVKAVLRDLAQTRQLLTSGRGQETCFVLPPQESPRSAPARAERVEERLEALLVRRGLLTAAELAGALAAERAEIEAVLSRLSAAGRVQAVPAEGASAYRATTFELALDPASGFEAALREHFSALVSTAVARLSSGCPATPDERAGASTYALDVWQGHPLEHEVFDTLRRVRATLSDLRARVMASSRNPPLSSRRTRALIYVGQALADAPGSERSR